jgi:hypothetical protein
MAYSVDTFSGSRTFTVEDGTINNSLDIFLIGKNYAGYGEALNENFVNLLENFAGTSPPPKPINGQIWYDASTRKLKVWDSAVGIWRITGSAEVAPLPPSGLSIGSLWWDDTNRQLYVYDGNTYVLVGPQGISTLGTTEIKSLSVTDNQNPPNTRAIMAAYVGGEILYVISKEEFTLSDDSANFLGLVEGSSSGRAAFSLIKEGITLVNTPEASGITTTDRRFHGTASSAIGLVDDQGNLLRAEDFVKSTQNLADFREIQVKFGDIGYTLGNDDDLEVKIQNDNHVLFRNKVGRIIRFQTRLGSLDYTPLVLNANAILPGIDASPLSSTDPGAGTDIGSTALRFRQVRALGFYGSFFGDGSQITNIDAANITGTIDVGNLAGTLNVDISGIADRANLLRVGTGVYRTASVSAPDNGVPDTVAVRTGTGDLCATVFRGTATTALFADLAEKYLADEDYSSGTVVTIGGSAEITAGNRGDRAFGVVSTNPAFRMNDGLEGGIYVALKGRVPVKVEGPVSKGDKLISGDDGVAVVLDDDADRINVFAIAVETNLEPGVKLVECVIL